MPKLLKSKNQSKVSEITKDLDIIDLPQQKDPSFKPESHDEWLDEMRYEESLMTQAEKDEAQKRCQATLKRMAKLYPSKFKRFTA